MNRQPDITPLRDASIGFGIWPWSEGPLWRLEEAWTFTLSTGGQVFTIPQGYEFDKASIPPVFWGAPFNYLPDGLCTVPALEHDFLCDLFHGGSAWLKGVMGQIPTAPAAPIIHRHFYDRLVDWGVRPSKAMTMYEGVRDFGPGGRLRPSTLWKKLFS